MIATAYMMSFACRSWERASSQSTRRNVYSSNAEGLRVEFDHGEMSFRIMDNLANSSLAPPSPLLPPAKRTTAPRLTASNTIVQIPRPQWPARHSAEGAALTPRQIAVGDGPLLEFLSWSDSAFRIPSAYGVHVRHKSDMKGRVGWYAQARWMVRRPLPPVTTSLCPRSSNKDGKVHKSPNYARRALTPTIPHPPSFP